MNAEQSHIALTDFLSIAAEDPRISPAHIALYLVLHTCWIGQSCVSPIQAAKRDIMRLSKISSNATYYRHLKDLNDSGYIKYVPVYHRYAKSLIYIRTF